MSVLLAASANVSAVPRTKSAARTSPMVTTSVTIITARAATMRARNTFIPATMRRRSWRSATTPAISPKTRWGR